MIEFKVKAGAPTTTAKFSVVTSLVNTSNGNMTTAIELGDVTIDNETAVNTGNNYNLQSDLSQLETNDISLAVVKETPDLPNPEDFTNVDNYGDLISNVKNGKFGSPVDSPDTFTIPEYTNENYLDDPASFKEGETIYFYDADPAEGGNLIGDFALGDAHLNAGGALTEKATIPSDTTFNIFDDTDRYFLKNHENVWITRDRDGDGATWSATKAVEIKITPEEPLYYEADVSDLLTDPTVTGSAGKPIKVPFGSTSAEVFAAIQADAAIATELGKDISSAGSPVEYEGWQADGSQNSFADDSVKLDSDIGNIYFEKTETVESDKHFYIHGKAKVTVPFTDVQLDAALTPTLEGRTTVKAFGNADDGYKNGGRNINLDIVPRAGDFFLIAGASGQLVLSGVTLEQLEDGDEIKIYDSETAGALLATVVIGTGGSSSAPDGIAIETYGVGVQLTGNTTYYIAVKQGTNDESSRISVAASGTGYAVITDSSYALTSSVAPLSPVSGRFDINRKDDMAATFGRVLAEHAEEFDGKPGIPIYLGKSTGGVFKTTLVIDTEKDVNYGIKNTYTTSNYSEAPTISDRLEEAVSGDQTVTFANYNDEDYKVLGSSYEVSYLIPDVNYISEGGFDIYNEDGTLKEHINESYSNPGNYKVTFTAYASERIILEPADPEEGFTVEVIDNSVFKSENGDVIHVSGVKPNTTVAGGNSVEITLPDYGDKFGHAGGSVYEVLPGESETDPVTLVLHVNQAGRIFGDRGRIQILTAKGGATSPIAYTLKDGDAIEPITMFSVTLPPPNPLYLSKYKIDEATGDFLEEEQYDAVTDIIADPAVPTHADVELGYYMLDGNGRQVDTDSIVNEELPIGEGTDGYNGWKIDTVGEEPLEDLTDKPVSYFEGEHSPVPLVNSINPTEMKYTDAASNEVPILPAAAGVNSVSLSIKLVGERSEPIDEENISNVIGTAGIVNNRFPENDSMELAAAGEVYEAGTQIWAYTKEKDAIDSELVFYGKIGTDTEITAAANDLLDWDGGKLYFYVTEVDKIISKESLSVEYSGEDYTLWGASFPSGNEFDEGSNEERTAQEVADSILSTLNDTYSKMGATAVHFEGDNEAVDSLPVIIKSGETETTDVPVTNWYYLDGATYKEFTTSNGELASGMVEYIGSLLTAAGTPENPQELTLYPAYSYTDSDSDMKVKYLADGAADFTYANVQAAPPAGITQPENYNIATTGVKVTLTTEPRHPFEPFPEGATDIIFSDSSIIPHNEVDVKNADEVTINLNEITYLLNGAGDPQILWSALSSAYATSGLKVYVTFDAEDAKRTVEGTINSDTGTVTVGFPANDISEPVVEVLGLADIGGHITISFADNDTTRSLEWPSSAVPFDAIETTPVLDYFLPTLNLTKETVADEPALKAMLEEMITVDEDGVTTIMPAKAVAVGGNEVLVNLGAAPRNWTLYSSGDGTTWNAVTITGPDDLATYLNKPETLVNIQYRLATAVDAKNGGDAEVISGTGAVGEKFGLAFITLELYNVDGSGREDELPLVLTAGNSDLYLHGDEPTSFAGRELTRLNQGVEPENVVTKEDFKLDLIFYYRSENYEAHIKQYIDETVGTLGSVQIGEEKIDIDSEWENEGLGRSVHVEQLNADGSKISLETKDGRGTIDYIEPNHSTSRDDYFAPNVVGGVKRLVEEYIVRYTITDGENVYVATRKLKLRYMTGDADLNMAINSADGTQAILNGAGAARLFVPSSGATAEETARCEECIVDILDMDGNGAGNSADGTQMILRGAGAVTGTIDMRW